MLPRLDISCKAQAIRKVWPYGKVAETFDQNVYCHSGIFISDKRVIANLERVTSLFADIDLVDVLVATHPDPAAYRKANSKALKKQLRDMIGPRSDDFCLDDLLRIGARAVLVACAAANVPVPTLILSSGWGLHVHWAVTPEDGASLADRVRAKDKALGRIPTLLNARFSPLFAASMLEQVQKEEWSPEVEAIFADPTTMQAWGALGVADENAGDLGTRLVRYPGDFNIKPGDEKQEVVVLHATDSVCRFVDFHNAKKVTAAQKAENPAIVNLRSFQAAMQKSMSMKPAKARSSAPFHLKTIPAGSHEGMTLRELGDTEIPYVPGEAVDTDIKVKTVSPFRPNAEGGSDGSAFLVRTNNGALALYCSVVGQWYDDSVAPDSKAPVGVEQDSPWGNSVGGAQLEHDTSKITDGRAAPFATVDNVLAILTQDAYFDTLVYDTFVGGFRMVQEDPDTGESYERPISNSSLVLQIERHAWTYYSRFNLSTNHAQQVCKRALTQFAAMRTDSESGRQYRMDWLATYVKSYQASWDGVPRLDEWLVRSTGCEDTALNRIYGRKWMLQLVATGMGLGSSQAILLLRGKQGGGKSSFGQILRWGKRRALLNSEEKAQPSAYTDKFADPTGAARDVASSLRQAWLVEDAEAIVLGSKHTAAVKAMLTSDTVTARAMYEMEDVEFRLRCCIYASTNEASVLSDSTGSRRVFGVDVADRMNLDYLVENRDKLFGEAVAFLLTDAAQADLHRGRSPWVIQSDEEMVDEAQIRRTVMEVQAEANRRHEIDPAWLEDALVLFRMNAGGKENAFTLEQFLLAADPDLTKSRITKPMRSEAKKALGMAGFVTHERGRGAQANINVCFAPTPHKKFAGVSQLGDGLGQLQNTLARKKAMTAALSEV